MKRLLFFIIMIFLIVPIFAITPLKRENYINTTKISDLNENKIQDILEEKAITMPTQKINIIIFLDKPYTEEQLNLFKSFDGVLKHTYEHATYGFSGSIQANMILELSQRLENLKFIEEDYPIEMHLDKSARIVRARNITWQVYGYNGSSNFSIAILDTGIDDSHPDLYGYQDQGWSSNNKIIGWNDVTADAETTPVDYKMHGTHVASIASGTGASYGSGIKTNTKTTFSYTLPSAGYCYIDKFEVKIPGKIILDGTVSTGEFEIDLKTPSGTTVASDSTAPWHIEYDTTTTGMWQAWGCNPAGTSGRPFSIIETYPYQDVGDSFNLFTGVAPNNRITGVKIFRNDGTGYVSDMLEGLDWIIANKITYRIKVASMSAGLVNGATDTNLRAAANNVVANGIVFSIAAGNDYPTYKIGDPALAEKVITVAATNDNDSITDYSSNGPTDSGKPDVAAPGGSFQLGFQLWSQITAADTNDDDGGIQTFADYNPNDYTNLIGTSMATPHVGGEAALIIQALESQGQIWGYTEAEALRVKMLILMTAVETNRPGEGGNNPTSNRGDKDLVEGYGRINIDAAIEAATMSHIIGTTESSTLGVASTDKKVWARKVNLTANIPYQFSLVVPSGADYDLFLYNSTPDVNGNPIILNKSVSATLGGSELINYIPPTNCSCYIVVKWVDGSGEFKLSSSIGKFISIVLIGYPVNFGNLDPGTNAAALGNLLDQYVIKINPETNVNVDIYQKGDDFNYSTAILGIGNMTWSKTNDVTTAKQVNKTYDVNPIANATPNTTITMYYWISIPPDQEAGDYSTNLYIKAVEAGSLP